MPIIVTKENFEKSIVKEKLPVVVDFWASWCAPCRMMAPVFEDLSKDYEGRAIFAKISTEDHPELAQKSSITGIPAIVVMKQGKEIGRIVGFAPKHVMKGKIDEIVGK